MVAWAFAALVVAGIALPAGAEYTQAARAREILDASGVTGGLVVHVGCGGGELTAALRTGPGLIVHGLDAKASNIAAARKHLQSRGLYGPVAVDVLELMFALISKLPPVILPVGDPGGVNTWAKPDAVNVPLTLS